MSKASIYRLQKSALARGYDPKVDPHIKEEYVIDVPRAGRPKVTNEADEANIIHHVQETRAGRESTCAQLGHQFGVSAMTIDRILRAQKMGKRKPSWKPWLTDAMKAARYEFAKTYEHWKLEDWKNVIWSDGTSVVLGHRRGAMREWRKPAERYHKTCIRTRWEGVSEFMFEAVFPTIGKGPCIYGRKKPPMNDGRSIKSWRPSINNLNQWRERNGRSQQHCHECIYEADPVAVLLHGNSRHRMELSRGKREPALTGNVTKS